MSRFPNVINYFLFLTKLIKNYRTTYLFRRKLQSNTNIINDQRTPVDDTCQSASIRGDLNGYEGLVNLWGWVATMVE